MFGLLYLSTWTVSFTLNEVCFNIIAQYSSTVIKTKTKTLPFQKIQIPSSPDSRLLYRICQTEISIYWSAPERERCSCRCLNCVINSNSPHCDVLLLYLLLLLYWSLYMCYIKNLIWVLLFLSFIMCNNHTKVSMRFISWNNNVTRYLCLFCFSCVFVASFL